MSHVFAAVALLAAASVLFKLFRKRADRDRVDVCPVCGNVPDACTCDGNVAS